MQIIVCKLVVLLFGQNNKAPKPKQCLSATGTNKMLQHAGRIMKLTAVLLLGVCMQIYAAGYGQRITLSERDVPIEKVLKKIQQQTTYKFLYTSQLLHRVPKVTVVVKDATVEDVLDMVLKGQMLDYEVSESTVVIRAKKEAPVKETTQADMPDPIEIRGVITDENGAPASGVNIAVKGTNKGTTTNLRGEFVLRDVSENAVLLITSVGYDRQEILVKGKEMINTQLRIAVGNLDEMQVIAYGKTSKRFNTGNVSSVKGMDIENQPVTNVMLALQGRVPGLFITQNTGITNGGLSIRIQGQNSISYGNNPFYVVDGVPYYITIPSTGLDAIFSDPDGGGGNPLAFLNPSDIESIEILKDADATAIYGSRAANGAILITTKKGKAGKMKVDVSIQKGLQNVNRMLKVLDRRQYLDMRYEAYKNDGIDISTLTTNSSNYDLKLWDTANDTNWQEKLLGNTGGYFNTSLNLSGGTSNYQYLVGGTFHSETTVFPGDFFDKRGSLHLSLSSASSNQKIRLQFSGNYMLDDNRLPNADLTQPALRLEPIAPAIYKEDGTLNWAPNASGSSTWTNPYADYMVQKRKYKTNSLVNNLNVSYNVISGLDFRCNFGYTNMQSYTVTVRPLDAVRPESRLTTGRAAGYANRNMNGWSIEPQLYYGNKNKQANFEAFIGASIQESSSRFQTIQGRGYTSDLVLEDLKSATSFTVSSGSALYKYNAVFGRLNYNWKDKYIINLNARRDGSSRFGNKNRFHNFGSIGLAWIFNKEKFIENNFHFLSFGKLRASYGSTGNDQIGDYSFLAAYFSTSVPIPYQNSSGLSSDVITNHYLQWEETNKLQFGVDFGFLKDRVIINASYQRNRSSNQLLMYSIPSITGAEGVLQNFPATVQNTSWELSVNVNNIKRGNFVWASNFNLTIPQNKLISFPDLSNTTYSNLMTIGQPLGVQRVFHSLGVDPLTGKYVIGDKDGNPVISPTYPDDYNKFINTLPKFYGGVLNKLSFKEIELEFLFQFVKQIGLNNLYYWNGFRTPGRFTAGNSNQPSTVLNRWQKPGDITNIQLFSTSSNLDVIVGDALYSDASYARLKNISLSWKLPANWLRNVFVKYCRLYIQGQNLLTITSYKGVDPENQSSAALAPLRVITIGGQLGF